MSSASAEPQSTADELSDAAWMPEGAGEQPAVMVATLVTVASAGAVMVATTPNEACPPTGRDAA